MGFLKGATKNADENCIADVADLTEREKIVKELDGKMLFVTVLYEFLGSIWLPHIAAMPYQQRKRLCSKKLWSVCHILPVRNS
jgi:hypothetical protein